MRLFHLGWWEGRLHLWGETSDDEAQVDATGSELLPRACRGEALVDLLDERGIALQNEPETLVAWLPTVDGTAVPSSSVLGDPPPDDTGATLDPWRVPVVPLDRITAVDLLRGCHDREMFAPGQLLGEDLTYWAHVVRYASALVAREQVLPGLQEQDGGTYQARWTPVFRGEEADRLGTLVQAMPGACRALSTSDDAPPEMPPRTVLQQLLGDLVDVVVRSGLRNRGRARAADRAAASFDSLHDQWLCALRAPDGRMAGDDEELAHLAGQLQAWRRRIEVTAEAPFRLVFRLEEPEVSAESEDIEGDPGPWTLRYRLQSTDDPPPFFLLSLKAGGTGLNLTRANHVFHYDRWWNPAVENQATDRAFRIGQTKRVQVHKFVCAGTLEERIDQMIERKEDLAEQVVDAGEDWVTELSTDELKDLFRLRSTDGGT